MLPLGDLAHQRATPSSCPDTLGGGVICIGRSPTLVQRGSLTFMGETVKERTYVSQNR